jgi:four helix bundle protein
MELNSEVRTEKSEVRTTDSEVRAANSEVRTEKSEVRTTDSEVRAANSEVRTEKSEVRNEDLSERLLCFAAAIIKLAPSLTPTATGRYISNQLVRSSASAGANYREARGGESHADFVHKMQIVLKELRESEYWLQLITRTGLARNADLGPALREADELIRIFVVSVVTAKSKQP